MFWAEVKSPLTPLLLQKTFKKLLLGNIANPPNYILCELKNLFAFLINMQIICASNFHRCLNTVRAL